MREYRDPTTWQRIGSALRGPTSPKEDDPEGHRGIDVKAGSELDVELRDWALSDNPRTLAVRRAEERLRTLLLRARAPRLAAIAARLRELELGLDWEANELDQHSAEMIAGLDTIARRADGLLEETRDMSLDDVAGEDAGDDARP